MVKEESETNRWWRKKLVSGSRDNPSPSPNPNPKMNPNTNYMFTQGLEYPNPKP
jgi:hypothetical protein